MFFFLTILEVHSYIDRLSKEYESPFRVWLGPILLVFITDAENTEILLKSKDCLGKPETFYKTIKDGLGVDGLVTLKGILNRFFSIRIDVHHIYSESFIGIGDFFFFY